MNDEQQAAAGVSMHWFWVALGSLGVVLIGALMWFGGSPFNSSSEQIPVIVDYSPTVSDVGGLMYLLSHPEVDVIAISLPATGEAGCELGMEVTLGLLALLEREDVPVACGSEAPDGAREWPIEFLSAHENLLFSLPKTSATPSALSAADLIAKAAADADRPVVIWAVAPLTNVARALERHAEAVDNIDRIVIMGGAIGVDGNVEGTQAEWNVWIDVAAAASVFESDVAIVLVPLDATNDVPVPVWYRRALSDSEQSDAIVYLTKLVRMFPQVTGGFFHFWDELAAVVVTHPDLVILEEMAISVLQGGSTDGSTQQEAGGTTIHVATGVPDPKAFYSEFLGTLSGSPLVLRDATTEERAYLEAIESLFATAQAEAEPAYSAMFGGDDFEGASFSKQLGLVFDAIDQAYVGMVALDPPASLAISHSEYATALRKTLDSRDEVLASIAAATSFDDLDPIFGGLAMNGACQSLTEEAVLLGVDLGDLPC